MPKASGIVDGNLLKVAKEQVHDLVKQAYELGSVPHSPRAAPGDRVLFPNGVELIYVKVVFGSHSLEVRIAGPKAGAAGSQALISEIKA